MAMGVDRRRWQIEGANPAGQHQPARVLLGGVARVGVVSMSP